MHAAVVPVRWRRSHVLGGCFGLRHAVRGWDGTKHDNETMEIGECLEWTTSYKLEAERRHLLRSTCKKSPVQAPRFFMLLLLAGK